MTIEEGNKIIAEFMGIQKKVFKNRGGKGWYVTSVQFPAISAAYYGDTKSYDYVISRLNRYHSSWDWLMPVGKKIDEYLQAQIKLRPPHTASHGDLLEVDIQCALREYSIEKTWESIVQFIQWYNTQHPKNLK